jgi:hypothetical protein
VPGTFGRDVRSDQLLVQFDGADVILPTPERLWWLTSVNAGLSAVGIVMDPSPDLGLYGRVVLVSDYGLGRSLTAVTAVGSWDDPFLKRAHPPSVVGNPQIRHYGETKWERLGYDELKGSTRTGSRPLSDILRNRALRTRGTRLEWARRSQAGSGASRANRLIGGDRSEEDSRG